MRTLTLLTLALFVAAPCATLADESQAARLEALAAQMNEVPEATLDSVAIGGGERAINSDCDGVGGIAYDNGEFNLGIRPATTEMSNMVTRFDLPSGTHRLDKVCVCWITDPPADDDAAFYVRVWSADGPGGAPGSLLGESAVQNITGVPGTAGRFYTVDLSHLNLERSGSIYIGPRWAPGISDVYLCADRDAATPLRPNYAGIESPGNTVPRSPVPEPQARALGIRASFDAVTGGGNCTASATTLCLNDNRFRVTVTWEDFQGQTGSGQAVPLPAYDDSGIFWFFSSNNLEMLIKVLDGCAINDRYWVFFAATTNVEFTVTVTDTLSGGTKVYTNPLGQSADAITDTGAFATCP